MCRILIEFQKLFQKKNIVFFLILICILNIVLFAYHQQSDPTFSQTSYIKLQEKLNDIPNQDRYDYIKNEYEKYHAFEIIETIQQIQNSDTENQKMINSLRNEYPDVEEKYQALYQENHETYYTDTIESEVVFLEDIYQEFEVLHQYSQYLQNIQEKAQTISSISIFQKENDFSQKNIQKTAQDYQSLFDIELTYESEKGIYDSLSFPMTNFFMMIAMFILAASMIIDEKEKNLFSMIKVTPKGQWSLMLIKCLVMIVMVGLLTVIMIFTQLFYMSCTLGLGNLSKTIQSLASYNYCSFHIDVWQFLILFFFVKWLAASFVGLMMMWILTITNHKIIALVWIIGMIGIEWLLYLLIPPLHNLYLLKYVNVISFLQIDIFFQIYRNVNCFGYPISLQGLMIVVLCFGFVFSMILSTGTYHYKKNMSMTHIKFPFHYQHRKISLSLFSQELYKTFIIQKVLILCVICIGLQIYQYHDMTIYKDFNTTIYIEYMKKLEGKLTDEKEEWILDQQNHYEALHKQEELLMTRKMNGEISEEQLEVLSSRITQELVGEEAFSQVLEQYQRIKDNPECDFVLPFAYQAVFLQKTWTILPTILLCLFLLLGLSQAFPYEYQNQMQRVTLVTVKGNRQLIKYKIGVAVIVCIIFLLLMTIPILILFHNTYGFSSLSSSIISIEQLSLLPSWITIGMGCIISLLIKLFAIVGMVMIMYAIALKTRHYILTCFVSILLFLVPLLLSYGNFHLLDTISLYPLLMNGLYVMDNDGLMQLLCSMIGYTFLFIYAVRYIYKHY